VCVCVIYLPGHCEDDDTGVCACMYIHTHTFRVQGLRFMAQGLGFRVYTHTHTHLKYLAGHCEDHVGAGVLVPARYVIHLVLDLHIHAQGLGFRFSSPGVSSADVSCTLSLICTYMCRV
jgi:hypothetical protein